MLPVKESEEIPASKDLLDHKDLLVYLVKREILVLLVKMGLLEQRESLVTLVGPDLLDNPDLLGQEEKLERLGHMDIPVEPV